MGVRQGAARTPSLGGPTSSHGHGTCATGRAGRVADILPPSVSSPLVDRSTELNRLLEASSDPDNPTAETLVELLTHARHIAVVGLSRYVDKPARRIPSYLAAKGYDVIPVNPNADRLLGRTSYDTLGQVPDPLDLVVVFRPSSDAGAIVLEALERPEAPAIWLQQGIRADDEIERAREAGRIAVQDLCVYRVHRFTAV
jgi:predicted CoA-binding protein